jgi:hypothetical protein
VLGQADDLQQGLAEIGEGLGGLRLDVTLGYGGEQAGQSHAEVAGGEIAAAGEAGGDVAAGLLCSEGLGFFAGAEVAEVRMAGMARSTAAAAVGEGESTQGHAVLGTKGGHGSLRRRTNRVVRKPRAKRDALVSKSDITGWYPVVNPKLLRSGSVSGNSTTNSGEEGHLRRNLAEWDFWELARIHFSGNRVYQDLISFLVHSASID